MMNRLPAIVARIHDDPVPMAQLLATRNLGGRSHQVAYQRSMLRISFGKGSKMLLRYDQQVCRGLRVDIGEANAEIVFIDAIGRNRTGNNLAKETV